MCCDGYQPGRSVLKTAGKGNQTERRRKSSRWETVPRDSWVKVSPEVEPVTEGDSIGCNDGKQNPDLRWKELGAPSRQNRRKRHITVQFKNIKAKNVRLTKAQEGAGAEPLQRTSRGPRQRHPRCKHWEGVLKVEGKALNLRFYIPPSCYPSTKARGEMQEDFTSRPSVKALRGGPQNKKHIWGLRGG